jgi:hypothetical protein
VSVPGILYEFRSPGIGGRRDLVLATYLVNGRYLDTGSSLDTYNSREVDLFRRGGTYLARIQISISATGDRQADLAVLSDFISEIITPVSSLMPGLP